MTKTVVLAALLAVALVASASEDAAEALGFRQGDAIPEADRAEDDAHHVMRRVWYPGKAGFDSIGVFYTEGQGVCMVAAIVSIDNAADDPYGVRHKREADKLIERVVKKMDGTPPSASFDVNRDTLFTDAHHWLRALERGSVAYGALWMAEDAVPFSIIRVEVGFGVANVIFSMANHSACHAEQEAADAAAF